MSIQKRGGRAKPYLVRLRDPGGREFSRSFELRRDAAAWEAEQRQAMAHGVWVDPRGGATRLREHADVWLRSPSVTSKALSTRTQRESLLRTHALPVFGHWPLRSLTLPQIESWAVGLVTAGKAPATAHQALSVLRMVLADAVRRGLIAINPAEGVQVPDHGSRVSHRYLSAAQVYELADAIDGRYRAVVLCGALAGMRIGEIAALTPAKIQAGVITIDQHVVETRGRTQVVAGTKSKRVPSRQVAVPPSLEAEIERHLRLYGTSAQGMVFGSHDGSKLLSRSWFGLRRFNPAVAVSVGFPMRVHDLRHTNVALSIGAGMSIVEISKRLGHASISVTSDVYAHLLDDVDRAAADALEEYMSASAGTVRASGLRVVEN